VQELVAELADQVRAIEDLAVHSTARSEEDEKVRRWGRLRAMLMSTPWSFAVLLSSLGLHFQS